MCSGCSNLVKENELPELYNLVFSPGLEIPNTDYGRCFMQTRHFKMDPSGSGSAPVNPQACGWSSTSIEPQYWLMCSLLSEYSYSYSYYIFYQRETSFVKEGSCVFVHHPHRRNPTETHHIEVSKVANSQEKTRSPNSPNSCGAMHMSETNNPFV